jgi:hypothetical protein
MPRFCSKVSSILIRFSQSTGENGNNAPTA